MPDNSSRSAASLPVVLIVIFVLITVIGLALAVVLVYQRKNTGYSRLVKKRAPGLPMFASSETHGKVVFPPDEANPRPISNVLLHPFLSHGSPASSAGASLPSRRNPNEESQSLMASVVPQSTASSDNRTQLEMQRVMLELHRLTRSQAPVLSTETRARIAELRARLQELNSRSYQPPTHTYQVPIRPDAHYYTPYAHLSPKKGSKG